MVLRCQDLTDGICIENLRVPAVASLLTPLFTVEIVSVLYVLAPEVAGW